MVEITCDIASVRAVVFAESGPMLAAERDASDFVSAALEGEAALAVIPVSRLGEDFFRLETRLAGEAIQKFVNYRLRVAIVGDVSAPIARSRAFRDFVVEANRGRSVWFAADLAELERRLA